MNTAAAIREMVARGLTTEQALIAIEVIEGQGIAKSAARLERKREVNRERQRAHRSRLSRVTALLTRDKRDSEQNQGVGGVTGEPLARVDTKPTNLEHTGKKNKPPERTARDILLECLKPETAEAVLAHRKAKRCPLTPYAAVLLTKGFRSTADPEGAAQTMISRGWQGFEPEWLNNERAGNGNGTRHGKGSIVEAGRKLTERLIAERLDRERTGVRGADGDPSVRLLPSFGGQRS